MNLRNKLKVVIFGTHTRAGKLFDVILLWVILISIFLIMLESVPALNEKYAHIFKPLEYIITGIFTIEYLIRIWVVQKRRGYIFSFFGIVDFISLIPTYIGFFVTGYHTLIILRAVRLLRLFRIFQLTDYLSESAQFGKAMLASVRRIIIFLSILIVVVMILGTIMFIVEGPDNGFSSIPQCIYWAIVTITTVGYGDITPVTVAGKIVSSLIMLLGYAIIAVPTGIVTAQLVKAGNESKIKKPNTKQLHCNTCGVDGLDASSIYCRICGNKLMKK